VLRSAKEYPSLADAIAEASLVIGTSRRGGKRRGMVLPVDEAAEKVFKTARRGGNVAVLFGRERVGLSSAEIDECAFIINIPTASRQPSLNIAQAVMLVAYELGKLQMETPSGESPGLLSTHAEQAALSERLTRVLELLGYTKMGDRTIARKILVTIKHFLGRTALTKDELDMLKGICTRLVKRLER
jgi:TrmH family RNA methyltransferase